MKKKFKGNELSVDFRNTPQPPTIITPFVQRISTIGHAGENGSMRPPMQDCFDPVTPDQILEAEQRMNVHLPSDYRQLLLECNGGFFQHEEVVSPQEPDDYPGLIGLDYLYGIDTRDASYDLAEEREFALADGLPPMLLLIGRDISGDGILLGLGGKYEGRVYLWWREEYHHPDDLILIKDSLDDFVRSIHEGPEIDIEEEAPVFQAIERGEAREVRAFLDNGNPVDSLSDKTGRTMLICAVYSRRLDIVQLLLERNANLAIADTNFGRAALHWAATSHSLDATKLLLAAGANMNQTDNEGKTPLMVGLEAHGIEIPMFLIRHGADVNVRDKHGRTAYSMTEHVEVRELL